MGHAKWRPCLDDPLSTRLPRTELLFAATLVLGSCPWRDRQSLLVQKAH